MSVEGQSANAAAAPNVTLPKLPSRSLPLPLPLPPSTALPWLLTIWSHSNARFLPFHFIRSSVHIHLRFFLLFAFCVLPKRAPKREQKRGKKADKNTAHLDSIPFPLPFPYIPYSQLSSCFVIKALGSARFVSVRLRFLASCLVRKPSDLLGYLRASLRAARRRSGQKRCCGARFCVSVLIGGSCAAFPQLFCITFVAILPFCLFCNFAFGFVFTLFTNYVHPTNNNNDKRQQ